MPCPIPPSPSPQPLQADIGAPKSACRPTAYLTSTRIRARTIASVTSSPPCRCPHAVYRCPPVDSGLSPYIRPGWEESWWDWLYKIDLPPEFWFSRSVSTLHHWTRGGRRQGASRVQCRCKARSNGFNRLTGPSTSQRWFCLPSSQAHCGGLELAPTLGDTRKLPPDPLVRASEWKIARAGRMVLPRHQSGYVLGFPTSWCPKLQKTAHSPINGRRTSSRSVRT